MFLQVSVCPQGEGGACLVGVVPGMGVPALGGSGLGVPAPRGSGIPACLAGFQAHSQEGSLGGYGQRGVSRPTPKGEVEGDQVQAHTQGGN